jgi:hypothetical protein
MGVPILSCDAFGKILLEVRTKGVHPEKKTGVLFIDMMTSVRESRGWNRGLHLLGLRPQDLFNTLFRKRFRHSHNRAYSSFRKAFLFRWNQ